MLFETPLDYVSLSLSLLFLFLPARASPLAARYMRLSARSLSIRPIKRCSAHKTFSIWHQKRRKGTRHALSEYGRRFLVELLKSSNQSEPDRHVVYINIKKITIKSWLLLFTSHYCSELELFEYFFLELLDL